MSQGSPPPPQFTPYNPNHVNPASFTDVPQSVICPFCRQSVVTRTVRKNGLLTWVAVGGLCLIGLWCGCQFIPLCIDDLKDVQHFCPNCNNLIGERKQLK